MLFASIVILAGCSLEKQSGFNRTMQNLTAHYNILFNAKEILRLKQVSYATSFVDNYNELLNVYPDTIAQSSTPDKDLEEAIAKANKIINIKEQSHYQGDAYLVLGKANYLEGNYFNANEFLNYVIKTYPARLDLVQDALTWKARSLMYLGELPQAKVALDTAIQNINPKKNKSLIADIYASKLQYDIDAQDYADGEEMAKQAISFCRDKMQRLRWTFILSQLQELNQKPADAIKNYSRVASSNVSFEMAFNASLNRIRIEDAREGIKASRTERLLALLKEPNNKEFKDQIYYQVAQLQMADKNIDGAIKNYKLSVRKSVNNKNQKGLSYLRLAEIYFKNKADYLSAKKYYDSTLTSLPVNYPGYAAVKKISTNLQLLANSYQVIAREDTLQALAKMDEKARNAVIDKMVNDRILQQQTALAAASASPVTETSPFGPRSGPAGTGNSFYFYNSNAVSQGYTDFKRKWGDRKLEDNWRRSSRSNSDVTANSVNTSNTDPDAPVSTQPGAKPKTATASGYRRELLDGLPLTPELVAQSNLKIYNAYIDIGNFYRDILGDKKEAIADYELILHRFPNDPNKAAVYYNLYRLYSDLDKAKSDHYKDLLLKDYADTPFAKIISDPGYAKKLEDENAEFTQAYNKMFDLYARKKYNDVISGVPLVLKQYPANKLSPQLYYLKTIAEGHNEKVTPFADSLKQIAQKFPDDKLVTPLINQHLAYINANQAELQSRPVVLTDDNPLDLPFTLNPALKEQTAYRPAVNPFAVNQQPQVRIERQQQVTTAQSAQSPTITSSTAQPAIKQIELTAPVVQQSAEKVDTLAQAKAPVIKIPDLAPSIFSMLDSTNYYFAINVKSGTTNLSSSRFGVGQFTRANYAGKGIKHQLLPVGANNQVIYVGRFFSLTDVKKYARAIVPLLPEIMKVPKDKYSFFIITQENLNKLADEKILDSYIDYYQRNF
jgi:tetratricopeptide (TPR) repeat protein